MTTPTKRKKMHPRLASARAYYRLAGKAWRAGQSGQAIAFREQGDRYRAMYDREMEAKARREQAAKEYEKKRQAMVKARAEAKPAG